jgi:hypothetical protein
MVAVDLGLVQVEPNGSTSLGTDGAPDPSGPQGGATTGCGGSTR